jgi:hypothetical protein
VAQPGIARFDLPWLHRQGLWKTVEEGWKKAQSLAAGIFLRPTEWDVVFCPFPTESAIIQCEVCKAGERHPC